jgi:translation initiation factor eIF-2B subunit delta
MNLSKIDQFKLILTDNKSGSVELLLNLNSWLKLNLHKMNNPHLIVKQIKSSLAHFQTINKYTEKLNVRLREGTESELMDFFEQTEFDLHSIHKKIFENGLSCFTKVKKIITISNSYSVNRFIVHLHNHKGVEEVIVSESRPIMEGRQLAEKLIENGILVRFITDAAASKYIRSVDAAIIGCDKILKDGTVINKTGSRQLAILCNYLNIPFYVIADKSKFSKSDNFTQENKPFDEIWDFQDKNLKIENLYFEKVEKDLITKVISD